MEYNPPELEAVLRYAVGPNYPEVAYGHEYPFRIRGAAALDIDGDGSTEVFVWAEPSLLQSPAITIYSIDESGKVTRAIEGLAPGPLAPAFGGRADTHVMGLGVDFPVEPPEADGEPDVPELARKSLEQGLHVVRYRDFIHTDGRGGQHGYIDMSWASPLDSDRVCGTFEFATLDDIAAGSLREDPDGGYLAAATAAGQIYLYRVDAITPEGLLVKHLWVVDPPPGYVELVTSEAGAIEYALADGTRRPVSRELAEP
jgi:hypothetical protein